MLAVMSPRRSRAAAGALFATSLLGLAGAAPLGGCGQDVQLAATASSGAGGAVATTGTAASSTGTGGLGGAGGGSLTTGSGAGGCTGPGPCGPGFYCNDFSDGCFLSAGGGVCDDASLCSGKGPVCGCDGAVYPTDCAAFAAGMDVAAAGCVTPPGTFLCHALVCSVGVQACVHYVGFATYDACEAFTGTCDPAQGGTPDCSCFPSWCKCAPDPAGNFVIECPTGD
jgi:hypothetical protein